MAKKLTNEVLEKLVMESIEEMGGLGEAYVQDFSRMGPQRRTTLFDRFPFFKKEKVKPKIDSVSNLSLRALKDFLNFISLGNDFSPDVRQYAQEFVDEIEKGKFTETSSSLKAPESEQGDFSFNQYPSKKVAESKMLESLVAKVLAEELSKKKEAPKQPKKPVKK